jgi:hypothetical protein
LDSKNWHVISFSNSRTGNYIYWFCNLRQFSTFMFKWLFASLQSYQRPCPTDIDAPLLICCVVQWPIMISCCKSMHADLYCIRDGCRVLCECFLITFKNKLRCKDSFSTNQKWDTFKLYHWSCVEEVIRVCPGYIYI